MKDEKDYDLNGVRLKWLLAAANMRKLTRCLDERDPR